VAKARTFAILPLPPAWFECRLHAVPGPGNRKPAQRSNTLQKYLLIAVGGALGSIARYWIGSAVASRLGTKFPFGTFVINITACVIVGFSLTYLGKRIEFSPAWRFLIPVGFVGAYSTFSTYEWETLSNLRAGAFLVAALYALGSLVAGLIAVWGGALLAEVIS
jgi:CrcB protein